ncbi:hypothetical protein U9M48_039249 [Paspalum notatum var. saurae]|uniref:NB-ARC domain-containing protein n=1 Tax=Paspalum notatum var. saurae TaxID=547442 RepID=A0AAQ3XBW1_PASNO
MAKEKYGLTFHLERQDKIVCRAYFSGEGWTGGRASHDPTDKHLVEGEKQWQGNRSETDEGRILMIWHFGNDEVKLATENGQVDLGSIIQPTCMRPSYPSIHTQSRAISKSSVPMAEPVVSAATGALKPLLEKLAATLGEEYKLFKGARGEVKSIAEELKFMHAFLLKMSDEENPDVQDKAWVKEMREPSYDMEDSVDEFKFHADEKSNNAHGLISKFKSFMDKIKARRDIAKAIEDLKIQVKEVADRNARYKARETISNSSNADVDRKALVMFENMSKLVVGLDMRKNMIIQRLKKTNGLQPPKVISIVGSGGIGKTTVAYQVYQDLKGEFESHAFVSVSRNPDYKSVLRNILHRLRDQGSCDSIQDWDLQLLISKINDFLGDKRYLVVIDDIWTKKAWKTISCALPTNDKNCKIITTTRDRAVAKACCSSDGDYVYEMKPLCDSDSRKLFLERLFGSEDKCPAHLRGISNKILEKCGGLPLAIISIISGLLASKPRKEDEWVRVQNTVGRGLENHPDTESMLQILSLSYFDLPYYLKTCLLYLSVFPEDSTINKKRLVRRWVAEGFIQKEQGRTLYELGERCFNDLVNRSLIQARGISMYGEVTACQVANTQYNADTNTHTTEPFVVVFGDGYEVPAPDSKVRRLSLHASREEKATALTDKNLSRVRSVTVFGNSVELPLSLRSKFSFLRVLDLQGCRKVEGHHLGNIGSSFQLKYLGLCETGVCELPEQIWKLKCIEILDPKETKVKELPAGIAQLQTLICLAIDKGVKLPDGIAGRLTALEDLDCVDIFKQSTSFPGELGQLEKLRNISLSLSSSENSSSVAGSDGTEYQEYLGNIASSLCKLGHIHFLSIDIEGKSRADLLSWALSGGDDAREYFSLDSSGGDDALPKAEINGSLKKLPYTL